MSPAVSCTHLDQIRDGAEVAGWMRGMPPLGRPVGPPPALPYLALALDGLTFKEWFLRNAHFYLEERLQTSLFDRPLPNTTSATGHRVGAKLGRANAGNNH